MKNSPTIAVLDYGIGNVRSIINAIENVGFKAKLTNDSTIVNKSDALILPGVGAFKSGMDNLKKFQLDAVIHDFVASGKVFIGICLGMQLMFDESEEFGITKGLSLIKGRVKILLNDSESEIRLPNISWNNLIEPAINRWESTLLENSDTKSNFYFIHSYVGDPSDNSDILALSSYGNHEFCAAVQKNNMYGFQFHPEKSGIDGLNILKNLKSII